METMFLILMVIIILLLLVILVTVISSRRETKEDVHGSMIHLSEMTLGQMENVRQTVEMRLRNLQEDNNRQLDRMRNTVDEKLQQTLERRITDSFTLVNKQLAQVSKGFGEMRSLTNDVGDIRKVLSNVKTRGVMGEVQLRAILNEILHSNQFKENVKTSTAYNGYVEFAVLLPGDEKGNVYLPIDSKFPANVYHTLVTIQETGDREKIRQGEKELEKALRKSAKDIRDKYIDPPYTTDFGILFLPFEGLYSEVAKLGLIEELQNDYKINVTGPSTMAAFLSSLQMGFKTLAIHRRTDEVWRTLEAVKTEFQKFQSGLEQMKKRLDMTNKELEVLMGTRTNQINRKLKNLSTIDEEESQRILGLEDRDYI